MEDGDSTSAAAAAANIKVDNMDAVDELEVKVVPVDISVATGGEGRRLWASPKYRSWLRCITCRTGAEETAFTWFRPLVERHDVKVEQMFDDSTESDAEPAIKADFSL